MMRTKPMTLKQLKYAAEAIPKLEKRFPRFEWTVSALAPPDPGLKALGPYDLVFEGHDKVRGAVITIRRPSRLDERGYRTGTGMVTVSCPEIPWDGVECIDLLDEVLREPK